MSDDNDSKKSIDRRRSARSTDIARKIVEEITARGEKNLNKQKDEGVAKDDSEKKSGDN